MAKFIYPILLGILLIVAVSAQEPENDMTLGVAGNAKPSMERVFCTKEYAPVCGSDGKTYGNKCEFDSAKRIKTDLTFKNGACDEQAS